MLTQPPIFKMENKTIDDKLKIIRTMIQVERDPHKKQKLNNRLQVLLFKQEIETIRKKIEQLSR